MKKSVFFAMRFLGLTFLTAHCAFIASVDAATNTFDFSYANRATLLGAGWSFIATNPDGSPRNTEITDTNIGAVVAWAQTNDSLGIVTRIPCDTGYLYSSATTIPDAVQDVPPLPVANQTRNSLFRNLPTNWVSMRLTMSIALQQDYQHASLVLYQDDDNYLDIGFRYNSDMANFFDMPGPTLVSLDREFYGFPNTVTATPVVASNIVLRLDRESATDVISAFYSLDGTNWISVGQTTQVLTNTQFGIVLGASPATFPLGDLPVCDLSQAVIITSESYSPPPPAMVAQPQHLVFNAIAGQPCVATQRVNVVLKNSNAPVSWSVSGNAAWLSASVASGPAPGFCDISVDTTGLLPGTHEGTLTFTAPDLSNSPVSTSVTLIVNPDNRVRVSTWRDAKAGAMSVSVDDSNPTAFDDLNTNGVAGTFAMWHSIAPPFYTDYYNAGMELAAHSVNHVCFEMHEPAFRFEIEGNIAGLVATTPVSPDQVIAFAWPCGFATIPRRVIASDYFLVARGYNINQLEDSTPNDFMNVKSYNSHENSPFPPADFKTLVDAAAVGGKWFNLVLHETDNGNGAISHAVTNNVWVAPIGSVTKYILQRDRTIITNYTESASLIQFDCHRLPLDPSSRRSFEKAIGANDMLTLQVDVTGIAVVSGLTVNNVPTSYTNRVINGRTLLCFNLSVGTNAQRIAVSTSYHYPLTVIVDDQARIYGAANPSFTGSVVGVQPGDNITATFTTVADATSPTGSYTIVPVFNDPDGQLTNYIVATNVGTLTISPAPLTVAADAQTKIYGSTDPMRTYQITSGALVGSDSFSGLLDRTPGENAGTYAINPGSLSAGPNYSVGFVPSTLTITPRLLTITADNKSKAYGAALPALTASCSGFVNGEDTNVLSGSPSLTTSATASSSVGGNPYSISATIGSLSAGNYSFVFVNGSLNITAAVLLPVVAVDNKIYDATTTATITNRSLSGVVGADDVSLVGGSATFSDKNAGLDKTVIVTGLSLSGADAFNYVLASTSATNSTISSSQTRPVPVADIFRATLTISADNKCKACGASNPALTASYYGFVPGDNTNSLTTLPTLNTSADTTSPAGTYAITASGAAAGNYNVAYVAGTLTVVSPPGLQNARINGNNFSFTVQTLTGLTYQVEYTEDLAGAWVAFGDPIIGTGNPVDITTTPSRPYGFFRVKIVP